MLMECWSRARLCWDSGVTIKSTQRAWGKSASVFIPILKGKKLRLHTLSHSLRVTGVCSTGPHDLKTCPSSQKRHQPRRSLPP